MRMFVDEVLDTFPHDLTFTGTDEGDYHIHAAATHCQADLLLTDDDPRDITTTENVHYDIICPDDFFVLVTKSAPPKMLYPIIKEQIAYWSKNPKHQQLDEALRRADCTEFAEIVRSALQRMALMSEI